MINAASISRAVACCAALALALTLAVAGPATASKHSKSGKPKVAVLTTSQSALTDRRQAQGQGQVEADAEDEAEGRAQAGRRQDQDRQAEEAEAEEGQARDRALRRSGQGGAARPQLSRHPPPRLHHLQVEAGEVRQRDPQGEEDHRYRQGRRKRDPSQCDGRDPVGVEVDTADRCDPISAPGEQCLFPYPNDFYTRPDSSDSDRVAARPEGGVDADQRPRRPRRPDRDQHQRRVQPRCSDRRSGSRAWTHRRRSRRPTRCRSPT